MVRLGRYRGAHRSPVVFICAILRSCPARPVARLPIAPPPLPWSRCRGRAPPLHAIRQSSGLPRKSHNSVVFGTERLGPLCRRISYLPRAHKLPTLNSVKSILIADGDERVAQLFAEIFAIYNWSVTWYSDGRLAGDEIGATAHYDAVLVSNRLHSMSGVELITRIRALDHRKDVPIVMVTGTVDPAVAAAALASGADDVLSKPTDVATLVATVSKCVERGRPRLSRLRRHPHHRNLPELLVGDVWASSSAAAARASASVA